MHAPYVAEIFEVPRVSGFLKTFQVAFVPIVKLYQSLNVGQNPDAQKNADESFRVRVLSMRH